jgi:signal transduction histidine kinase
MAGAPLRGIASILMPALWVLCVALVVDRGAPKQDEEDGNSSSQRRDLLYELLRELQPPGTQAQVAQRAANALVDLTNWNCAILLRADEGVLRLEGRAGQFAERPTAVVVAPIPTLLRETMENNAPRLVTQVQGTKLASLLRAPRALILPLEGKNDAPWLLCLGSDRSGAFTGEERSWAESLADVVAISLQNAGLYEILQAEIVERQHVESRLWSSIRKLDSLYQISRSLVGKYELEDILEAATRAVVRALNADRAVLITLDVERQEVLNIVGAGPGLGHVAHVSYEELLEGLTGWVIRKNVPALSPKGHDDPRESPQVRRRREDTQAGSLIVAPIAMDEHRYGTLTVINRPEGRDFTQADVDLVMAMAAQVSGAIYRAELYQQMLEQQHRLEAVIEASRDGIALVASDLTLPVLNQPILTLVGLSGTPQAWKDAPLTAIMDRLRESAPEAADTVEAELRRLEAGGESRQKGEFRVGQKILSWLNLPIPRQQETGGRLIVLRDVTEERALEELRKDLVTTMVHDLRNPLTGIDAALKIFLSSELEMSASHRRLLKVANSSSERVLKLISAILEISRLESGHMPLNLSDFSVLPLIDEVVGTQRALAEEHDLTVTVVGDDELPPARADATLVYRVIENLISNALKFTTRGGRVEVGARMDEARPEKLTLWVKDSGPPIPPELESRIFEKFVAGPQEHAGSGLGLAFCAMAVRAHGERIWLDNDDRSGKAFIFTLPRASTTAE